MKRNGPFPLQVHLSMALEALQRDDESLAETAYAQMLSGVQKYQRNDAPRHVMRGDVIWSLGNTALRYFPAHAEKGVEGGETILLIPSMINDAQIFDLHPQKSFVHYLNKRGINVAVLDWGDICSAGIQDMSGLYERILLPCTEALTGHIGNKTSVHALGYCMGGVMLLGLCSLWQGRNDELPFRTITLLAMPWDFHAGTGRLKHSVEFWYPQAREMIAEKMVLPMGWTQTVFAAMNPLHNAQKFIRFSQMQNKDDIETFVAAEDWLNSGTDLPGTIAREFIEGWILNNDPASGRWHIAGHNVDVRGLEIPVHVIASKRDNLVEFDCANAVTLCLPSAVLHTPECGHIGMMAGRHSEKQVWHNIADFIFRN